MRRASAARALAVVAPWAWFLVRDAGPFVELVAVLLPLLALVAIVVLVTLARRGDSWLLAPAASLALVNMIAVVGPWIPLDTGTPDAGVSIVVANVLARNPSPDQVVADILGADADIAVVPEAWGDVHDRLADAYPHARRADRRDTALGVYSRVPITELEFVPDLLDRSRQIRLEVDAPSGPFVLWAVHFPKPWFTSAGSSQMRPPGVANKLDQFLDAFAAEDLPVVVAGDTNLTDRGRGYRKLTAQLDDAMRGTWGGPTARKWYLRPLLLRVDHVLVPEDWCADEARRLALTGSDHRGVRVRVGPCD